jgi:hypothetical protein
MKIETKDEYIRYRFKRAEESFDDALIMIENKKMVLPLVDQVKDFISEIKKLINQ